MKGTTNTLTINKLEDFVSVPLDHFAAKDLSLPLAVGRVGPALARGSSAVLSAGVTTPRTGMGDPHQPTSKISAASILTFKIGLPKYIYNDVTMSELARGTGYTLSMVSKIFSHDRGLSIGAAKEFAKYLGLSVDKTIELVENWGS